MVLTLAIMSPFLTSMVSNRRKTSGHMMNLWTMNHYNRIIIYLLTALRLVIACVLVVYVFLHFLPLPQWIVISIAIVLVLFISRSKFLMRHYWTLESAFVINLNERQMEENHQKILENQGKLSKRDGDKMGFPVFPLFWTSPTGETSRGYREDGYLAEAFINMLSLLGWNPGTEQEIFSMQELIDAFSLERVSKAGARFQPDKAKSTTELSPLLSKRNKKRTYRQRCIRKA